MSPIDELSPQVWTLIGLAWHLCTIFLGVMAYINKLREVIDKNAERTPIPNASKMQTLVALIPGNQTLMYVFSGFFLNMLLAFRINLDDEAYCGTLMVFVYLFMSLFMVFYVSRIFTIYMKIHRPKNPLYPVIFLAGSLTVMVSAHVGVALNSVVMSKEAVNNVCVDMVFGVNVPVMTTVYMLLVVAATFMTIKIYMRSKVTYICFIMESLPNFVFFTILWIASVVIYVDPVNALYLTSRSGFVFIVGGLFIGSSAGVLFTPILSTISCCWRRRDKGNYNAVRQDESVTAALVDGEEIDQAEVGSIQPPSDSIPMTIIPSNSVFHRTIWNAVPTTVISANKAVWQEKLRKIEPMDVPASGYINLTSEFLFNFFEGLRKIHESIAKNHATSFVALARQLEYVLTDEDENFNDNVDKLYPLFKSLQNELPPGMIHLMQQVQKTDITPSVRTSALIKVYGYSLKICEKVLSNK
jgi:hypothetical protein